MNIPLELRQKILLLTLDDETLLKDIVIAMEDLDYASDHKVPKGSLVKRWAHTLSDIHPQLADEMGSVQKQALVMLEKEEERVVALVVKWRDAVAQWTMLSYLWWALCLFHTGIPDSAMELEKQRLDFRKKGRSFASKFILFGC